jgi:hypothetical protein
MMPIRYALKAFLANNIKPKRNIFEKCQQLFRYL